jgi:hypothetical protein
MIKLQDKIMDIKFECICGLNFKNKTQHNKHKTKCNKLKTKAEGIESSIPNDFKCIYCNKTLASKFSCERHMIICKSKISDSNEKYSKILKEKFLEVEKDMFLLKKFINLFDTSNEKDREILLQNDLYKKQLDFLIKYNSNNQQQNIRHIHK